MEVLIRYASLSDVSAITDIYNEAILNTTATFDTEIKSLDHQKTWFHKREKRYPLLVAEADSTVVAWASLNPWSDKCAYADTAEISTYVHAHHRLCCRFLRKMPCQRKLYPGGAPLCWSQFTLRKPKARYNAPKLKSATTSMIATSVN